MNQDNKSQKHYFFQQWRISSQILCFAILIQCIIGIIVFAIAINFFNLTIEYLKQSSLLGIQMENHHQIGRFKELQTYSSSNYFEDQFQKLLSIDLLFQFNQKNNIQIESPLQCLNSTFGYDKYANLTQFCFSYFGNDQNSKNQSLDNQFRQLSSTMSQYFPLMNQDGILYFASTTPDQYFSSWNSTIKSTFVPSQRQWYIDHIANMNSQTFVMSAPYLSQVDKIRLAVTHNLSLLDNQFVGIVAEDIDFRLMTTFQFENIEMQMVNEKDQLIISDLYKKNGTQIYKIYDEEYSGINQSDWQQLKNNSNYLGSYTQYIYSSIVRQDILISVIKLDSPPIYIILTINDHEYQQDLDYFFIQFDDFKIYYRNLSFFLFLIFTVLSLIFQYSFIKWMNKDIEKIQQLAFKTIHSQYYQKRLTQNSQTQNVTSMFKELYLAFERFSNFHSEKQKKNPICKSIEILKYPQLSYYEKIEVIDQLEIQCKLIHPCFIIKNIFDIFRKKKPGKLKQSLLRHSLNLESGYN